MHAIFNSMQELFTRENVTFAIAVFGAVGTAWNLFQSRRKIEFIPIGFKLKDDNELIVHFEIINHSRIAISIVNISYLYDDVHYSCNLSRTNAIKEPNRLLYTTFSATIGGARWYFGIYSI